MISTKQAIAKIVEQNHKVQNLIQTQIGLRQETEKRCSALQNQANQLIGRNEALKELFDLSNEELEAAVLADDKTRHLRSPVVLSAPEPVDSDPKS